MRDFERETELSSPPEEPFAGFPIALVGYKNFSKKLDFRAD
jgi:hypothetical protein